MCKNKEFFFFGIVLSPWRGIDPRKLINTMGEVNMIHNKNFMWEGNQIIGNKREVLINLSLILSLVIEFFSTEFNWETTREVSRQSHISMRRTTFFNLFEHDKKGSESINLWNSVAFRLQRTTLL